MTQPEGADARLLRRVRNQLVAWSGGVVLVVLLILGASVYVAVAKSLEANGIQQLQDRADNLQQALLRSTGRPGPIEIAFGGSGSGTLALIVTPDGDVIRPASLQLSAGLPDTTGVEAARAQGGRDIRTATVSGVPFRILSIPFGTTGQAYVLQVVQDTTAEHQTLNTLLLVLAGGGLVAVLVALAAGSVNARRALVPIRDALRRQREFAADASHELRTPLAVVRASVDHLKRNASRPVGEVGTALEDITAEVDHLTGLVEDLLLLARSDSGAVDLAREPVDLGEVATDATGGLAGLAAEDGVTLALDPEPVMLMADATRLRQLVTILVDNGIRHGPTGGTVTVTVRREPGGREGGRDGTAVLTVDDDGPGVPVEDRLHVFDRFWRAPGARPGGTGLGLSIAAWIVERHGGTIAATDRPDGVAGSRFTVRLPAGVTSEPRPARREAVGDPPSEPQPLT